MLCGYSTNFRPGLAGQKKVISCIEKDSKNPPRWYLHKYFPQRKSHKGKNKTGVIVWLTHWSCQSLVFFEHYKQK